MHASAASATPCRSLGPGRAAFWGSLCWTPLPAQQQSWCAPGNLLLPPPLVGRSLSDGPPRPPAFPPARHLAAEAAPLPPIVPRLQREPAVAARPTQQGHPLQRLRHAVQVRGYARWVFARWGAWALRGRPAPGMHAAGGPYNAAPSWPPTARREHSLPASSTHNPPCAAGRRRWLAGPAAAPPQQPQQPSRPAPAPRARHPPQAHQPAGLHCAFQPAQAWRGTPAAAAAAAVRQPGAARAAAGGQAAACGGLTRPPPAPPRLGGRCRCLGLAPAVPTPPEFVHHSGACAAGALSPCPQPAAWPFDAAA